MDRLYKVCSTGHNLSVVVGPVAEDAMREGQKGMTCGEVGMLGSRLQAVLDSTRCAIRSSLPSGRCGFSCQSSDLQIERSVNVCLFQGMWLILVE